MKIEETEKRKAEEKMRREQIFRQYQDKKHKDDEEHSPPVRRRAKSREKQRPKSMFAKNMGGSEEGLHYMSTSQEDLGGTAFTISPGSQAGRSRDQSCDYHVIGVFVYWHITQYTAI